MIFNIAAYRREAVFLLQLFSIAVYLIFANAHVCEVGREKNKNDKWMWVLPYDKPCLCTHIVMGGMNTWTPIRPFKPTYVKNPLLSDDITKIRTHYKLRCKEKGITQSMTMSTSLKAALSSTDFGNSSEEVTSQTAAKLSAFVSLFSSTASEPSIEQATTSNNATGKASTSAASPTTKARRAITSNTTPKEASSSSTTTAGKAESSHNSTLKASSSAATPGAASSTTAVQGATTSTTSQKAVTIVQECESIPLGMVSGEIPDSNITASSFHKANREPKYARLGSDNFWSAESAKDSAPWIRVFLGSSFLVTGLQTESAGGTPTWYWVKTLTVKVGMSDQSLQFIEDGQAEPKVFNATGGPDEVVNVTLNSNGIPTQFVEIYPTNCWQENPTDGRKESSFCVLRFEILGCFEL